jgi:hypothetical protein
MRHYRQRSLHMVALVLGLSCSTAARAMTRVALVSTCGGQAGDDVLALAEAKLSAAPDIVLVERAEVQRILEEQKLNHCGLSEVAQAVTVGKLLGVEVFAALEMYPNSHETLGLVVFDAATGVRLLDEALPSGDLARQAESLAAATQAACVKRERTRRDLHTVCVLSVRNAEFPSSLDSLCESMGRMLERRLLGSANLALLERERLEQINIERSLPTDSPAKELLASLTLLELEFSRADQTNGAKATVFLTDATGATLGKVQAFGNLEQPVDLVESLLQKVTQALNAAPAPQTMDRPREARRFRDEANFLIDQDQIANALQAAEAAYALDPSDKESRPLLAHALCGTASGLLSPPCSPENLKRALGLASRGADLCLQIRAESSPDSARDFFYPLPAQETAFGGFLWSARVILQRSDDESRPEWIELQGKYRRLLVERQEQITAAASADPMSFHRHAWDLYWLIGELELGEPTSTAWTTDVVEILNRVVALVDKFGTCNIGPGGVNLMWASILYRTREPTRAAADGRGLSWNLDEADKVRLGAFFG